MLLLCLLMTGTLHATVSGANGRFAGQQLPAVASCTIRTQLTTKPLECSSAHYHDVHDQPSGEYGADIIIGSGNGCTSMIPASPGRLRQAVLVRRGGCAFSQKALNAQVAHFIAVIIVDSEPNPGPLLSVRR